MTLYAGVSPRHVNSYHHNNSLLFQFILIEFLDASAEIQRFSSLGESRSTAQPPEDEISSQQQRIDHQIIETTLVNLVGSTKDYMRLISWNFSEGILAKLRTYCSLFLADTDAKESAAIQHYAEKIWQHCLQATNIVHESPQDLPALYTLLKKSIAEMQRFSKVIIRLIYEFKQDENVIFFILRHQKSFDKLYGNRFVAKLCSQLYPKGIKDALHLLVTKYTKRGFENMLPAIRAAAAQVEASS